MQEKYLQSIRKQLEAIGKVQFADKTEIKGKVIDEGKIEIGISIQFEDDNVDYDGTKFLVESRANITFMTKGLKQVAKYRIYEAYFMFNGSDFVPAIPNEIRFGFLSVDNT